jgi:murein DD-endopeptidase MepM/ murein hydrolase activator NlpD
MGQVLGYMGHTGNAIYTPPHLHLEVQPGGIPVPPKPFVDRWLIFAEQKAQTLVTEVTGKEFASLQPQMSASASAFRTLRAFDLSGGGITVGEAPEPLLALSGIQPSVSSMELAREMVFQMAWEIDWAGRSEAELAELARQADAAGSKDLSGASPWQPLGVEVAPEAQIPEVGD